MINTKLAGAGGNQLDGMITNPALGTLNNNVFNGGDADYLSNIISKSVGLLFVAGGIGFFFMLIWGAVSWILSGGDKAHVESAKARITNASIGLVLLVGSIAIIKLIERFFGVNILSIDIGALIIQ